jgi:hypothetical protein
VGKALYSTVTGCGFTLSHDCLQHGFVPPSVRSSLAVDVDPSAIDVIGQLLETMTDRVTLPAMVKPQSLVTVKYVEGGQSKHRTPPNVHSVSALLSISTTPTLPPTVAQGHLPHSEHHTVYCTI